MLSRQCSAALAAIDAHPNPTYEQLLEVLSSHRELLERTRAFAEAMEAAKERRPDVVPMYGAAAAATMLYQELDAEETAGARCVVVHLVHHRGRRP